MESEVKQSFGILAAVALVSALMGGCAGKAVSDANQQDAVNEAFNQLRGTGNVPGTANGQESSGSFMPSDSPPACLPNGTVTYEIYDEAANMRYWVFRWPENGGYSVVPRYAVGEYGRIIRYAPPNINAEEMNDTSSEKEGD